MSTLYRLVYASESNVGQGDKGINLEIGRILTKSKSNNAKLSIGGVLYYADGHFFQVLEGDKERVQSLYQKLCLDERHSHAKILAEGYIQAPQFADWTMHFVPAASSIRLLLNDFGFTRFTPFVFSQPLIETLITALSENGRYTPKSAKPTSFLGAVVAKIKKILGKKQTA